MREGARVEKGGTPYPHDGFGRTPLYPPPHARDSTRTRYWSRRTRSALKGEGCAIGNTLWRETEGADNGRCRLFFQIKRFGKGRKLRRSLASGSDLGTLGCRVAQGERFPKRRRLFTQKTLGRTRGSGQLHARVMRDDTGSTPGLGPAPPLIFGCGFGGVEWQPTAGRREKAGIIGLGLLFNPKASLPCPNTTGVWWTKSSVSDVTRTRFTHRPVGSVSLFARFDPVGVKSGLPVTQAASTSRRVSTVRFIPPRLGWAVTGQRL